MKTTKLKVVIIFTTFLAFLWHGCSDDESLPPDSTPSCQLIKEIWSTGIQAHLCYNANDQIELREQAVVQTGVLDTRTTYSYDSQGNLVEEITQVFTQSGVFYEKYEFTYATGNMTTANRSDSQDGVVYSLNTLATYSYNQNGLLANIFYTEANGTPIGNLECIYSQDSVVETVYSFLDNSGNVTSTRTKTYQYDTNPAILRYFPGSSFFPELVDLNGLATNNVTQVQTVIRDAGGNVTNTFTFSYSFTYDPDDCAVTEDRNGIFTRNYEY